MDIHKPKPVHTLREFLVEIGTIICGILIALGLEQLVEWAHWSEKVREARTRLASEIAEDLGQAALFDRSRACVERRLDDLTKIVTTAQATGRLPPVGAIGQPNWFSWDTGVWQSLVSDQTATHFSHDELAGYTATYEFIHTIDQASQDQLATWVTLTSLIGPGRKFEPGEGAVYLQTITKARFQIRFIAGVGLRAQQVAAADELPVNDGVFHSYADLAPPKGLCDPISSVPEPLYGQAPWKDSVERMRAHPITRSSNGMGGLK